MKRTEVVLAERTIIGKEHEVRTALHRQRWNGALETSPGDVRLERMPDGRIRTRVTIREWRTVSWSKAHPTAHAILCALAWVTGLAVVCIALIAGLGILVFSQVDGRSLAGVLGALAVVIMVLVAANRSNHSGACPGIAVHCKGCKH